MCSSDLIGLPLETKELMNDTIELNRRIHKEMPDVQLNCYVCQPYHGTRLRDFCEKENLLRKMEPNTVLGDPVLKNPHVSDEVIMEYRDNFHEMVTGTIRK